MVDLGALILLADQGSGPQPFRRGAGKVVRDEVGRDEVPGYLQRGRFPQSSKTSGEITLSGRMSCVCAREGTAGL